MPRDRIDGPFDELNEAFARGVLEGEARASQDRPRETRRRRQAPLGPLVAIAAIVGAVLITWMLTRSDPSMSQDQHVDVGEPHGVETSMAAVLDATPAAEPVLQPGRPAQPSAPDVEGGVTYVEPPNPPVVEQQPPAEVAPEPVVEPLVDPEPAPSSTTPIRDLVGGLLGGLGGG